MVAEREFGERTSSKDRGIVGAKSVVYDQPVVKDQEGAVDALEGIIVNSFVGQVKEHLREQTQKQLICYLLQQ